MLTLTYVFASLAASILSAPIESSNAYLDPGSGSFLLQILLAALLGGLFVLRSYWGKVKTFFANLFSKEENEE
jgi:ribose/xylose/arabinose/galactoside ABC-type transport system permease subunit